MEGEEGCNVRGAPTVIDYGIGDYNVPFSIQIFFFFTRCMTAPRLIPPPLPPPPHLLADSSADLSDFITSQIPAVPSSILSIGRFPLSGNFHECKQIGTSIKQRRLIVACARLSDSIRSGNVLKAKLRRARLGKGGGGIEF